ncbi:hypothetical protein IV45_GL000415 [Limosilactobacillus secaliphilus]|uniref:Lysozyme n=1 Tax=Limosilactobacillus secaliphilus TaxID=396268 RepID=A0A0R2I874_9LACO|nr:hypothetical protein IV45_GL000415 [Limosilactobacillus secaliphilus]
MFFAVSAFAWMYIRPVLEQKKQQAKTVQEKELINLIEGLADTVVTSLVSRTDITGHDKFKAATSQVRHSLDAKGLSATEGTIQTAVQLAYEKSNLTPIVKPTEGMQTGVVFKAIDVSGYQAQAQAASWWQNAKQHDIQGGIVKLSEGTSYRNPYGETQIAAIKAVGLKVSGYHFARFVGNADLAQQEANYAVSTAHAMNLPNGSPLVLDYELRHGWAK